MAVKQSLLLARALDADALSDVLLPLADRGGLPGIEPDYTIGQSKVKLTILPKI